MKYAIVLLLGALCASVQAAQFVDPITGEVVYTPDDARGVVTSGWAAGSAIDYALAEKLARRLTARRADEARSEIELRAMQRDTALMREWLCKRFCADGITQLPASPIVPVDPRLGGVVDDAVTTVPGTTMVRPGGTVIDPYRRGGAVIVDPTERAVYSGPYGEKAVADRYNARARAEYGRNVRPVNVGVEVYANGAQQQPYIQPRMVPTPYTDPVAGYNTGTLNTLPGQGGCMTITPQCTSVVSAPCATPYCGTTCAQPCSTGCAPCGSYCQAPCGTSCGTSYCGTSACCMSKGKPYPRAKPYLLPWRGRVAGALYGTSSTMPVGYGCAPGGCGSGCAH
jgi:hypothetical protein